MLPVFGRGFRQHALNVCAARGAFHAEISFGAGTVSASGGIEMSEFVNVKSEIGRLRRVMLHRPGIELQNLMPDYLERMLAEDTPDVRRAGEEHDVFAGILRANGVDVVYIEDMFKEVVKDDAVRKAFIKDFVELGVRGLSLSKAVTEYLESVPYDKLFDAVAKGITRADLSGVADKPIQYYIKEDYPFLTDPLPNLYFTRDISFCLGTGMAISAMSMPARMRETLFVRYIHKYSEYFGKGAVDMLYDFNCGCGIEGGDVLSLSDKCVAIGSGERTSVAAVERLALTLFKRGYERVLLFKNPSSRTYMHLDVLMTHIDYDKFLAHPCIAHKWFDIYELTPAANGGINVSCTTDGTAKILERALGIDKVTFVEMGGGDPIQYRREHWNMGSNSLAMAPGSIITYDRNIITNELIDKAGVKVIVNYFLVAVPSLNIVGAAIGTLTCYAVITALDLVAIRRRISTKPRVLRNMLRPALAAVLMGAVTFGAYRLAGRILSPKLACLLALVIAVVCYAVLVVLLRCITYQDCLLLPKGEKIAKLLHLREKT